MRWLDTFKGLKRAEHRTAWLVAMAADALQLGFFPLFAAGAASPVNDALDIFVAAVLTRMLGWHWAFLPSLLAELIPGMDLFPTWTAAVFFVTRKADSTQPEILPPVTNPRG